MKGSGRIEEKGGKVVVLFTNISKNISNMQENIRNMRKKNVERWSEYIMLVHWAMFYQCKKNCYFGMPL